MTHVAFVGAVDSGKSTLLGRLMLTTGNIPEDRLAEAVLATGAGADGWSHNTLAWLVDGLRAERETGATIDVAYRHLTVFGRRVVVHDCPGHGELAPAVFTGLSTAEVVVVVIDAEKGITPLAQWHLRLVNMLVPKLVILAVNKADLPGGGGNRCDQLASRAAVFLLDVPRVDVLEVSGLRGDNVEELARRIAAAGGIPHGAEPLRVVVQHVEPLSGADLVYGRVTGDRQRLTTGDPVHVTPTGRSGAVGRVSGARSVRLVLSGGTGVRRGSVLYDVCQSSLLPVATLTGTAVLLRPWPLRVGEPLRVRVGAAEATADSLLTGVLQSGVPTEIEIPLRSRLFVDDYSTSSALGTAVLLSADTHRIIGGMTLSREET